MALLDIGDLSRETGVTPSALRHYEALGLIRSVARRGLRRQFEPETAQRVALILLGRMAGFSLDEIGSMFGEDEAGPKRAKLRARADAIGMQIRRLSALRDMIIHVADCPAPRHADCPKFQALMRLAVKVGPRRDTGFS